MTPKRLRHSARGDRGFTFAELLAAMLFAAIVIPVAIQGITLANRAGVIADRTRTATQLGNRLLTEMVETGEWQYADQSGNFGDYWPNYQWFLNNEGWIEDTMRVVTVIVRFTVQEREYFIQLSALVEEETQEAALDEEMG